ncbi:MAG: peptide chain release factor N(5)-glutamine methyltransferase [Ramlibacter sp.]|nr:peptide chain release factor N(5)-glutamine methyltransferase [Ramlibacter sp.]
MTTLARALEAAATLGLARLDAQLLLLHTLGRAQNERAWLLAHDTDLLEDDQRAGYFGVCRRRAAGEPLAYIVGRKEFFGLDLRVDRRVLVPRPETETLVEWALDVLPAAPNARVIDLGTGSGAIALAIKTARPDARVEATDVSADALAVAEANARALSLEVLLRQGSWLADAPGPYDLIVSNPPYVAQEDSHLAALAHEPLGALAAGPDGLRDLSAIVEQAPGRLASGGWLLLEHGYDQAPAVRELLGAAGFGSVTSRCDLAGIERCSGGKWLELG